MSTEHMSTEPMRTESNDDAEDDNEELTFREKVFMAVRAIPPGETRTYREVAAESGNDKAARAVAAVLAKNPYHYAATHNELGQCTDGRYVACHNVVRSGFDPTKPGAFEHLPYLGEKTEEASAKRKKLMTSGL